MFDGSVAAALCYYRVRSRKKHDCYGGSAQVPRRARPVLSMSTLSPLQPHRYAPPPPATQEESQERGILSMGTGNEVENTACRQSHRSADVCAYALGLSAAAFFAASARERLILDAFDLRYREQRGAAW
jgi:hypothetical protein